MRKKTRGKEAAATGLSAAKLKLYQINLQTIMTRREGRSGGVSGEAGRSIIKLSAANLKTCQVYLQVFMAWSGEGGGVGELTRSVSKVSPASIKKSRVACRL